MHAERIQKIFEKSGGKEELCQLCAFRQFGFCFGWRGAKRSVSGIVSDITVPSAEDPCGKIQTIGTCDSQCDLNWKDLLSCCGDVLCSGIVTSGMWDSTDTDLCGDWFVVGGVCLENIRVYRKPVLLYGCASDFDL